MSARDQPPPGSSGIANTSPSSSLDSSPISTLDVSLSLISRRATHGSSSTRLGRENAGERATGTIHAARAPRRELQERHAARRLSGSLVPPIALGRM